MKPQSDDNYSDDFEVEEEFACCICLDLMFQPVTTNCGHSFCKECLKRAPFCPTCRAPLSDSRNQVNITLQKIIEKRYPEKLNKKRTEVQEQMKNEEAKRNTIESLPVVICDSYLYPGMKTIMTVDTRQLRDMVHVVTSMSSGLQANRKFIVVRKLTDMRGVVMILKQVLRTSQVIAEVVGDQRVVIDSIFIPEDRRGIYQNDNDALHFAKGRLIHDEDPYNKVIQEISDRILNNPSADEDTLERQVTEAKQAEMTEIMTSLNHMKQLFQDESRSRLREDLPWQTLEATFGHYPIVYNSGQSAIDALRERLQKESLYVLSHLEFQTQNPDLIFTENGLERMNACISELQNMQETKHQRLFVWEVDPQIKKDEANQTMMWLVLAVVLLYVGGRYTS